MNGNGPRGIVLQERDYEILLGLFECRVMALRHVTALYFNGNGETSKKRVQKLKQSGYIRERSRAIGEPSILHLTRTGFLAIREAGKLDAFPAIGAAAFEKRAQVSDLTLRHELEVMDVRTAFCTAVAETPNLAITEFTTWPALYQFTARHESPVYGRRELLMKPDGFIRIKETKSDGIYEDMFFLEVDRSTETLETLAQKAACYLDYYQSGGMAIRFGAKPENFREYPFRVLIVFKGELRLKNAGQRLLGNNPPILTQTWLSTMAQVSHAPLGLIWVTPKNMGGERQSLFHTKTALTVLC